MAYDTNSSFEDHDKLIDYIENIPLKNIVLLAVHDSASNLLSDIVY